MEHIRTAKVENVKMLDRLNPRTSASGNLYLTTSHLIFIQDGKEGKETWILHMLMSAIEKPLLTTSGTQLRIFCSHFQTATFIIQRDRDAHDVYQSLLELSKPQSVRDLYCFSYNPKGELRQPIGWHFHDLMAEFQRQGVPNANWTTCSLNKDYTLCPTYPRYLFVPAAALLEEIEGSARFRSKGRLPVLTYLHSNGAAIIRCAQPLVGMSGVRSTHDENYVQRLRQATPANGDKASTDCPAPVIHIIDTRPAMNAIANKAGGKGYESDKYYENIVFTFKGIENIHKIRQSLRQLVTSLGTSAWVTIAGGGGGSNGSSSAAAGAVPAGGGPSPPPSVEAFITEIANSGWLKHIKAVLDSSVAIVDRILQNRSVIVHCSDGWDRTSQTCALACLMLDPYYRTIHGFQALIEKDWLAFGHKFTDRCGHLVGDPQETSPTFVQFLDCVWQLTQMFPAAFQFNERYLITIEEHAYSCQYGTFVGNCDKQREELGLRDKTYSLWGCLAISFSNSDQFINPMYGKSADGESIDDASLLPAVLRPQLAPQNIKFWSGLYCRFEKAAHPRESSLDVLAITLNHTLSLEEHSKQLSKTINYYSKKIANSKLTADVIRMIGMADASPSSSPAKEVPAAPSPDRPTREDQFKDLDKADEADGSLYLAAAVDEVDECCVALEEVPDVNDEEDDQGSKGQETEEAAAGSGSLTEATPATYDPLMNNELEKIEQKLTRMKASIVEKCQSNRFFRLGESFILSAESKIRPTPSISALPAAETAETPLDAQEEAIEAPEFDPAGTSSEQTEFFAEDLLDCGSLGWVQGEEGDWYDEYPDDEYVDEEYAVASGEGDAVLRQDQEDEGTRVKADNPSAGPNEEGTLIPYNLAKLELESVAVDWVNWRLSRQCNVCHREFDCSASGVGTHCRRCGQIYCLRCITRKLPLRGHSSKKPVPVCNICCKALVSLGEVSDRKDGASGSQVDPVQLEYEVQNGSTTINSPM